MEVVLDSQGTNLLPKKLMLLLLETLNLRLYASFSPIPLSSYRTKLALTNLNVEIWPINFLK